MRIPSYFVNAADLIDLQQQVTRLQALLQASRQVHAALQLEEVLMSILRIIARELEMKGALFTQPHRVYGEMPPEPWEGCPRFSVEGKDGMYSTELVVWPGSVRPLSLYEQDFLEGLVLQAAVAIENAHYHERSIEWARVQQDLEAGRAVQRSMLPHAMPQIAGHSVAVRSSPCYEVGGDYVDLMTLPDGSELMVVADVAGKGLASAIMSSSFRSAFRASVAAGLPLAEIAESLNRQHCAEDEEARRRYVTAIYLRLDPNANTLDIVNAGHNPGFLVLPNGEARQINASGTPIGLIPGAQYVVETHSFPAGSQLLFYTDGLTEMFRGEEEFGPERLLTAFSEFKRLDAAAVLDSLWQRIHHFSGGGPQCDDMTALALVRSDTTQEKAHG